MGLARQFLLFSLPFTVFSSPQVVNGLMEREDWETAIKTPIGMLPTGSGNALCASFFYEAKYEESLLSRVCVVGCKCIIQIGCPACLFF